MPTNTIANDIINGYQGSRISPETTEPNGARETIASQYTGGLKELLGGQGSDSSSRPGGS